MHLFGIDKKYQRLRRSFEDSDFVFQTYSLWVSLTIILFGFFAIRPLILLTIEKQRLIRELKTVNNNLNSNVVQLEQHRQGVLTDAKAIEYLDVYMPPRYETQNYIVQLNDAIASAGYYLKTVSALDLGNNTLSISVRLAGPGNFPKLLSEIEGMRRLTTIENVNYALDTHSSVAGDSDVTLTLLIYSQEGRQ